MTAAEYMGWIEYSALEPFGEVRADTRAAVVASTFVRVMAGKKSQNIRLIDFMPFVKAQREAAEREPAQRARNIMLEFEANLGATKVRRVRLVREGGR